MDVAELAVVVLEVAAVAVLALAPSVEGLAVLRPEVRAQLAVLQQLLQAVRKPTFAAVWAVASCYEVPAELHFHLGSLEHFASVACLLGLLQLVPGQGGLLWRGIVSGASVSDERHSVGSLLHVAPSLAVRTYHGNHL